LVAGINAHQTIHGLPEFVMKRDESYIGVLIDDLVCKGVDEPYRMFTSRAEHRILLRQDNADERLTARGYELGLVSPERKEIYDTKQQMISSLTGFLSSTMVKAEDINTWLEGQGTGGLQHSCKIRDLITRPQISIHNLAEAVPALKEAISTMSEEVIEETEISIKYEGYILREKQAADKLQRLEQIHLPEDYDYSQLQSLSTEARQKLNRLHPTNIGEASRIPGVSPNDISVLLVMMGR